MLFAFTYENKRYENILDVFFKPAKHIIIRIIGGEDVDKWESE
jgi:hypothetical protein